MNNHKCFFYLNTFVLMYKTFKLEIEKIGINSNTEIFLAISGGIDSMVLSDLLIQSGISHTLLHCNFKLRDTESDYDEEFIRQHAKKNKLDYHINCFDTNEKANELKLTTQECARKLRYDWFFTYLNNENSILLTAHHLDDSIETFLINLLRGTGLKGLTGINSGDRQIYRPLLPFSKVEIHEFALKNNIIYREDSSNLSNNYLRNKLRHQLIPNLKSLSENFDSKISTLFTELKETDVFIENYLAAQKLTLNKTKQIRISDLNHIPQFMWHRLFSEFGLSRIHRLELVKLTKSITGSIFNSSTHILLKDRENIIIKAASKIDDILILIKSVESNIKLKNSELKLNEIVKGQKRNFRSNCAYLDLDKISWPMTLRNYRNGDKMVPFGLKGNKLISKILKDKKLNKFQKERQYVIESNGKVIWLLDLVISNQFSITEETSRIIKIEHIQY